MKRSAIERDVERTLAEIERLTTILLEGREWMVLNPATLDGEWRPLTAKRVRVLGMVLSAHHRLLDKVMPDLSREEAPEASKAGLAKLLGAGAKPPTHQDKVLLATKVRSVMYESGNAESPDGSHVGASVSLRSERK